MAVAVPAVPAVYVRILRPTPELEGLFQKAADDLMNFFNPLLGFQETGGDRVGHQLLPERFKQPDLLRVQFQSLALFVVQHLARLVDLLKLKLERFIRHERIEVLFQGWEVRLIEDRLAKLLCALNDDAFFCNSFHVRQDDSRPEPGGNFSV